MSADFQSPERRWRALAQRDPSAHSSFLYGVKSTRVYCRPTCTARLARRANVVFFDTEAQARENGFRPCKRCRPDDPGFRGEKEAVTAKVLEIVCVRGDDVSVLSAGARAKGKPNSRHPNLKTLASSVGVTTSYMCRAFKETMGVTIGEYIAAFEASEAYPREETGCLVSCQGTAIGFLCAGTEETGQGGVSVLAGCAAPVEDLDLHFNIDDWLRTECFACDDCIG